MKIDKILQNKKKIFHIVLVFLFLVFAWYDNQEKQTVIRTAEQDFRKISSSSGTAKATSTKADKKESISNNTFNDNDFYRVVRVVDGDTLVAEINGKNKKIRLLGVNTPETVDPRRPVECFGKEASNKAKELLKNQKIILLSDSSQLDVDRYGRLLRYVWLKNGLFFNLAMIKEGYAYEYTYDTPYKYQEEFNKAEQYARENKLGLWVDGVCGDK